MRIIWLLAILAALGIGFIVIFENNPRLALMEAQRTLPTRLAARGLTISEPVFLRIFKEESEVEVWMRDADQWRLFQSYPICRYSGSLGPKLRRGDRQAPEGFYRVSSGQLNPNSRHHLSFDLGFPNAFDRAHGRTGSYLMIHGGCSSIGCYAMTDPAVDDIYRLVSAALDAGQDGVDVHAFPFRMTATNMVRHSRSQWIDFWRDLKNAYDRFETARAVPSVRVAGKRYVVEW